MHVSSLSTMVCQSGCIGQRFPRVCASGSVDGELQRGLLRHACKSRRANEPNPEGTSRPECLVCSQDRRFNSAKGARTAVLSVLRALNPLRASKASLQKTLLRTFFPWVSIGRKEQTFEGGSELFDPHPTARKTLYPTRRSPQRCCLRIRF